VADRAAYERLYKWSIEDPQDFWAHMAQDYFWAKKVRRGRGCPLCLLDQSARDVSLPRGAHPPTHTHTPQWDAQHHAANFDMRQGPIHVDWFKGGTTNVAYNCLDRWVAAGRGNHVAFLW
jgi:acetyl-CoA synthetase